MTQPTSPSRSITVDGRTIGPGAEPFVIAEVSGNHNGDLQRALDIVDAAAGAGAHAIKLQTYRADTITIDADGPAFRIGGEHELWAGQNLFKLYEQAEGVLKEGTRLVPPGNERNDKALYGMYVLLFQSAQARDDKASMVASMEKAKEVAGEGHPEISFNLGSTYAVMEPPQKEKAVRLLNQFTKGACRGGNAAKFKEQCATASGLIQRLGS